MSMIDIWTPTIKHSQRKNFQTLFTHFAQFTLESEMPFENAMKRYEIFN